MKRNLYIDCDGVIYNTITYAFREMQYLGIDISNEDNITKYFKNCDWLKLIKESGQINNSCKKILMLKESNKFDTVSIATHHNTYQEGQIKNQIFKSDIGGIQVFNIPVKIPKHFALNARGHILVDDSLKKIISWIDDGGYGVLFNAKVNGIIYPTDNIPYFVTSDLSNLIVIDDYINENLIDKNKCLR